MTTLSAERWQEVSGETIELQRRTLGAEHRDTLNTMGDLAWVLEAEHHYAEAEKLQREALSIEQRIQGPDDVDTTVSETATNKSN